MLTFLAVIPARYASSRFPGKPLADIGGKSMVQRVYESTSQVISNTIVATDDHRIFTAVGDFGGRAVMTSADHQSGTDRCREALEIIEMKERINVDVVLNIQGDEPFIRRDQIELLKSCFSDTETDIATLIRSVDNDSLITDPNRPKVVVDRNGFAMYFSRSPIPYIRNHEDKGWASIHTFYQHIGIYAFRSHILKEITKLPQSALEKAESLEQLRWLENGYRIKTAVTGFDTFGIDTPDDLERALESGLF